MTDLTAIKSSLGVDVFRHALNRLNHPIAIIDAHRQIAFVNASWNELASVRGQETSGAAEGVDLITAFERLGLSDDAGSPLSAKALDAVFNGRVGEFECALRGPAAHYAIRMTSLEGTASDSLCILVALTPQPGAVAHCTNHDEALGPGVDGVHATNTLERLNASLRENAWQLSEAHRIAGIGHWERDLLTNRVRWSNEVYNIFGLARESTTPSVEAFLRIIHPEDRARVRDTVRDSIRRKRDLRLAFRVIRPDGTVRHLEDRAEVASDAQGRATRMFGTVQDITEQKRLEIRLRDRAIAHSIGARIRDTDRNADEQATWHWLIGAIVDEFEFAGAWYGESNGHQLNVCCQVGMSHDAPKVIQINAPGLGDADVERTMRAAVKAGRPFRCEDLSGHLQSRRGASDRDMPDYHSHVALPVIVDSNVTGGLMLQADKSAAFLPERIEHLQELVNMLGDRLYRFRAEREAANAIRQRERQLLQVIAEMPIMMIAFAENGAIVAWNHECERVTGFSAHEITNQPDAISRLYPGNKHKEVFYKNWMMHSGDFRDWELETACKDGGRRVIAWSRVSDRFPIFGWAKWGIGIDVTERRKAEQALAQSERDYRGLFDNAHDAIILFRPEDEVVLEANPHACRLYGLSRTEFIGTSLRDISKDVDRGRSRIAETMRLGKNLGFETTQYRSDGSPMLLEINAAVIEYRGEPAILTINRDITNRRSAEEAVRASEARYRWLADHSTDIILRIATDGTILDASHASRSILGYAPEDLVGENCADLVTPEYREAILATLRRAVDEPGPHRLSLRLQTTDQRDRWLECLIEGLRDPRETSVREIVAVARDVSLRKQEEELRELRSQELSHVNRLVTLGEMAGQIAHQLHQPLTAISNYAGTMSNLIRKAGDGVPSEIEPFCDEIIRSAVRTGEFIHRIRAFTQRRGLRRSPAKLADIVANALSLCETRLQRMGVHTSYDESTDLPEVRVDTIQIEQVLVNLINNAIDAMTPRDPSQRRLSVRARFEQSLVRACVRDTGIGIPDESRHHLFQPFYTTKAEGVGMGLVISQRIIEAHGGELWIKSHEDGGTSVYFTISPGENNDNDD